MCKCLGVHKALPNIRSVYVTLQDYKPYLHKIYTDISQSGVSVTLCNSALGPTSKTNKFPLLMVIICKELITIQYSLTP